MDETSPNDAASPRRPERRGPIPLPEAEHRRYARMLLAVGLAGLLFCGGQAARWRQEHDRAAAAERAVQRLYDSALGGKPGTSPYGRLQFELGKLRAAAAQRLDMVELLAALSRRAPESIRIRSLAMAAQNGTARGTAGSEADFERYKAALATEQAFEFSVTRAEAAAGRIRFELSVKTRDRAAPPKGDAL